MSVLVGAMIQCDQIARLFFNIWPFTSRKICQKVYKICQSSFKFLPNRKIGQDFEDFAKVWSHWTHPALPQKMFNALLRSSPVFARITWHSLFKRRTGGGLLRSLLCCCEPPKSKRFFVSGICFSPKNRFIATRVASKTYCPIDRQCGAATATRLFVFLAPFLF